MSLQDSQLTTIFYYTIPQFLRYYTIPQTTSKPHKHSPTQPKQQNLNKKLSNILLTIRANNRSFPHTRVLVQNPPISIFTSGREVYPNTQQSRTNSPPHLSARAQNHTNPTQTTKHQPHSLLGLVRYSPYDAMSHFSPRFTKTHSTRCLRL